jgi:galactose-1-phosphate uridylyltransferase
MWQIIMQKISKENCVTKIEVGGVKWPFYVIRATASQVKMHLVNFLLPLVEPNKVGTEVNN